MLGATTECGWSQHLRWDTNYKYRIGGQDINLVNPVSMTAMMGMLMLCLLCGSRLLVIR